MDIVWVNNFWIEFFGSMDSGQWTLQRWFFYCFQTSDHNPFQESGFLNFTMCLFRSIFSPNISAQCVQCNCTMYNVHNVYIDSIAGPLFTNSIRSWDEGLVYSIIDHSQQWQWWWWWRGTLLAAISGVSNTLGKTRERGGKNENM